jgi:hypothetical protein
MPLPAGIVLLIRQSPSRGAARSECGPRPKKDVLELRRIEVEKIMAEKWDGALPTAIYAGAPIPFLNVGK